jgi:REP element-mobilizing transposase RayT
MPHDPQKHHRRSLRLPGVAYASPGAYFVTICAFQRHCLFGQVVDGVVNLNRFGRLVETEWLRSPDIRREIELDAFVVMPNHLHGIVWIVGTDQTAAGARGPSPLPTSNISSGQPVRGPSPKSLGAFVAGFKSTVTKQINQLRVTPGQPVWQRNYWERVVRDERALHAIRRYIQNNPIRWVEDDLHPNKNQTP